MQAAALLPSRTGFKVKFGLKGATGELQAVAQLSSHKPAQNRGNLCTYTACTVLTAFFRRVFSPQREIFKSVGWDFLLAKGISPEHHREARASMLVKIHTCARCCPTDLSFPWLKVSGITNLPCQSWHAEMGQLGKNLLGWCQLTPARAGFICTMLYLAIHSQPRIPQQPNPGGFSPHHPSGGQQSWAGATSHPQSSPASCCQHQSLPKSCPGGALSVIVPLRNTHP